jgi:hypothetical protein
MAKKRKVRHWDEPLRHPDHSRPVTRRDFVAQGFLTGSAYALGGGVMSLFSNPRQALAALSGDLDTAGCGISLGGAAKIPFICFDLAGGANIAGSNVLVGPTPMASLSQIPISALHSTRTAPSSVVWKPA